MKRKIEVNKIHTYGGHKDCLYTLEAYDDESFFSAGGDGMVVKWSLRVPEKGTMVAKVPASIYSLAFDKSLGHLTVGQNFEGIHVIDVDNRKEVGTLKLTEAAIFDLQIDGDLLYAGTGDGEVLVIDRAKLRILHRSKHSQKSARTITVSENSVFVGYSDNRIRVFSKDDFSLKYEIDAHKISVFALQYQPESNILISGSRDAHLKIWDAVTMNQQEVIAAHMYAINDIQFSADRQHFVTCSMDKSIKVWDAHSYKLLKVIDKSRHAGHGTSVNKLLWMKYRNLLVSCSDDRSISVWDLNFGE